MKQKTINRLKVVAAVFSTCAITLNMNKLVSLPQGKFVLDVPYKVERLKKDNKKLTMKKR